MSKLLLLLLEKPRGPRFSTGQLDKLADVFVNLGIVIVGSIILPTIVPGVRKPNVLLLVCGVVIALSFWVTAFSLMKEVEI